MKKLIILVLLLLQSLSSVKASQTDAYYFNATNPTTNSVATKGGVISTTINANTGALATTLTPSFLIGTNCYDQQSLTMSATATTSSGSTNAIFNISNTKYIVLTNNTVTPTLASVTNITSGAPTATSNPNAIAYQVDDPTAFYGLNITYNSTSKNWQIKTTTYGYMTTALDIPASTPLANTFSTADEAGNYRATITLSFN